MLSYILNYFLYTVPIIVVIISPLLFTATDNHVGYMEKDPVRCNDSLESFEEILKVAKSQEVIKNVIAFLIVIAAKFQALSALGVCSG